MKQLLALLMLAGVLAVAPVHGETDVKTKPQGAQGSGLNRGAGAEEYEKALGFACGRGVARDLAQAARWFRRAAEKGNAEAQSALGWMLMTGRGVKRNDVESAFWLRKAADLGDVPAQNNLGILYATGQGVPHDHAQAERLFRAAAEQGALDAQRNLEALLVQASESAQALTSVPARLM